jgi:transcriptional regulator with XRE-family HTH domain
MSGSQIRQKRMSAGIVGRLLCTHAKLDRGRLSHIERGYIQPSDAELARIDLALDDLIRAKRKLTEAAARLGWPVSAL